MIFQTCLAIQNRGDVRERLTSAQLVRAFVAFGRMWFAEDVVLFFVSTPHYFGLIALTCTFLTNLIGYLIVGNSHECRCIFAYAVAAVTESRFPVFH